MGQITFKIPDKEMKFLSYVSKANGSAISSIYRDRTIDYYKKWKIEYLLRDLEVGKIGFKVFCDLGSLSPLEAMIVIEESNMETKLPEIVDEYTSSVAKTIKVEELFRKGKTPKRKSPEVVIDY